jgi:hypothetical protein
VAKAIPPISPMSLPLFTRAYWREVEEIGGITHPPGLVAVPFTLSISSICTK